MQQVIQILDEMIEEYDHKMYLAFCWNPAIEIDKEAKAKLIEAKSRIQALWDGEYLEEIIENMNIPLAITNCGEHNWWSKWEIRTTPYEKWEWKTLKEAILSLKLKLLHKQ